MVYHGTENFAYPDLDLLSLLFDSESCKAQENTQLHIDAADPLNAITKSQARDLTQQIAHGLRHRFEIGASGPYKDVVLCVSSGQIILPIVFYAVIAAGGVFSSASYSFTPPELARQIKDGDCNVIICSEDTKDVAIAAAKACGLPLDRILLLKSSPRWSLNSLVDGQCCISTEKLDWTRITDKEELENSLICLLYSSGTTGIPKGVCLSHTNLVSSAAMLGHQNESYVRERNAQGYTFEYRTIAHLPTAHIAGTLGYFALPIYMGGSTYWMPKFDFAKFLEYNKRYRITFFFTVPPIYLLIAKSPLVTDQFDTLEGAVSGAAPMGKELQRAASAKLGKGKTYISQTWGLTETTGSVTSMAWDRHDETGSVSGLLPNMKARIVDDNGKEVAPGERGEVLVKGPVVTKRYFNNPNATKSAYIDGWNLTGDIGSMENNLLYIVDRKKELIKYKGHQVAPAELEALLISHPRILDAAVIGIDGQGTELPRAYVVTSGDISAEEIQEFVKGNVADFKRLRGGILFVEAIPKSAAGKILRKDLRALAEQELKAKL